MKKLILALVILTSATFAFEKKNDSYKYKAVGVDFILPAFSIGYRDWAAKNGFDINLNVSSLVFINRLSLNASYLRRLGSKTYIGVGGGAFLTMIYLNKIAYASTGIFPSFKIGWESKHHFQEVNVEVPLMTAYGTSFVPLVSYRYGF